MKTLVTGGAGFIGSNFVEMLFDNTDDEITVLDVFTYAASPDNIPERIKTSPRFKLVRGNIRHAITVNQLVAEADRVVHFAAESHVARSLTPVDDTVFFETDVMGSLVIAQAVAQHCDRIQRFVHISTSEVYGTNEGVSPPRTMSEEHPLNPRTPYAAAKAGADRLVYAYHACHGIPLVLIRPFNNYGPKQHLEKVVPRFIAAAITDQPLRVHGDGQMTRDWLYVEDCCRGVLKALDAPGIIGETINLGTGVDTSVLDIAEMVVAALGKPRSLIQHMEARPGQVDQHIASTAKALDRLDWWAEVPLGAGLEKTVAWYVDHPEWWQRQLHVREIGVVDRAGKVAGF